MIIKKLVEFNTDENCYVIYGKDSKNCIVIDPGGEKILDFLKESKLSVDAILLTHCHYDHTCCAEKIKDMTGAPIIGSSECMENIKSPFVNVSAMFGEGLHTAVDKVISDNEIIKYSGLEIKCIKTPGHTSCSVCYLIEDNLFSGDTLFLRTTGRWDLPTGNYDELAASLKEKIYCLDDNIKVFPGHGNDTTVGYEKKFNLSICL